VEIFLKNEISLIYSCDAGFLCNFLLIQGYRSTLETFDEEYNKSENSLNSRSKLVEYLSIEKLYEKNKARK